MGTRGNPYHTTGISRRMPQCYSGRCKYQTQSGQWEHVGTPTTRLAFPPGCLSVTQDVVSIRHSQDNGNTWEPYHTTGISPRMPQYYSGRCKYQTQSGQWEHVGTPTTRLAFPPGCLSVTQDVVSIRHSQDNGNTWEPLPHDWHFPQDASVLLRTL